MPVRVDSGNPEDDVDVPTIEEMNEAIRDAVLNLVNKPVERADLADDVKASLKLADSAVQPSSPTTTPLPFIYRSSDFNNLFWHPTAGNAVVENPSFHRFTAPNGDLGFEFVCDDQNQTSWSPNNRAVLARKDNVVQIGQTQHWAFKLCFPKQQFKGGAPAGLFWQYHTATSSGHYLAVNLDNTFHLSRQISIGENYARNWSGGPPILFDTWQPIGVRIKWSYGDDGLLQYFINGVKVLDFSGPTVFQNDGIPYLQTGLYAQRPSGIKNIAQIVDIRRTII